MEKKKQAKIIYTQTAKEAVELAFQNKDAVIYLRGRKSSK
jgi:hypothetical protein